MNDLKFSIGVLDSIYEEAKRDDMTLAERAGLYAAAKIVCDEFRSYIDRERDGYAYAHQKIREYEWHIGAALGFDVTNGHDKGHHLSSTLGAFWMLRDLLTENVTAK